MTLTFGAKDPEPAKWDGAARISQGEIIKIVGHHFDDKARVLPGNKWQCSTNPWGRFSGGMHPNGREHEYYIEVAEEVKEHTGDDHVPGTVVISAPIDLKKIERLEKAGFDSVAFNIEVWDRNIFAGICPGKARTIGWGNYLKALEYAGRIFEHGKVRSMFVSGLESRDSFLKGAEYLASKNVLAFHMPWTPNPGSKLEGHRTPLPSWHLDLSRKLVDIWQRYGYTAEHLKELPLSRNYLFFDEMAGRV